MSDAAAQFFSAAMDREAHSDATESTQVGRIAVKFGLGKGAVLTRARQELGHEATLGWFCAAYPTFPFLVGYRKTPWQHEALEDLRKRFTKTPCYKGWLEIKESQSSYDERPVACIFQWPGIGACVLREVAAVESPMVGEFSLYIGNRDVTFLIEPFDSFLGRVEWTPTHQSTD